MLLHAPLFSLIPEETARVAQAAFPHGHIYMQMRDELGPIYDNAIVYGMNRGTFAKEMSIVYHTRMFLSVHLLSRIYYR